MSLDMTIGARTADIEVVDATVSQEAQQARRHLLQDLAVIAGTSFSVVFASALSVLLFLR